MKIRKTNSTATTKRQKAPVQQPDQLAPITLTGRLCADPVLRTTKTGKSVTTIRLAVHAPDAETTFHSVVVWNRTAEVVCEYMRKGRHVEVTGREQARSYQAADGTERQLTEIVAYRVQFLSGRTSSPASEGEREAA